MKRQVRLSRHGEIIAKGVIDSQCESLSEWRVDIGAADERYRNDSAHRGIP